MVFVFMGRLFLKPNIVERLNLPDYEFVLKFLYIFTASYISLPLYNIWQLL